MKPLFNILTVLFDLTFDPDKVSRVRRCRPGHYPAVVRDSGNSPPLTLKYALRRRMGLPAGGGLTLNLTMYMVI